MQVLKNCSHDIICISTRETVLQSTRCHQEMLWLGMPKLPYSISVALFRSGGPGCFFFRLLCVFLLKDPFSWLTVSTYSFIRQVAYLFFFHICHLHSWVPLVTDMQFWKLCIHPTIFIWYPYENLEFHKRRTDCHLRPRTRFSGQ